jgi:hypothetical protein
MYLEFQYSASSSTHFNAMCHLALCSGIADTFGVLSRIMMYHGFVYSNFYIFKKIKHNYSTATT